MGKGTQQVPDPVFSPEVLCHSNGIDIPIGRPVAKDSQRLGGRSLC